MMKKLIQLMIVFAGFLIIIPANAQFTKENLSGSWKGKLSVNGVSLRIIFNISEDESGKLMATLDSPDQGAQGIPMGEVIFSDEKVSIGAPAIGAKYEGNYENENTISGIWSQGGQAFELKMSKSDEEFTLIRPQNPTPPFPYISEEVKIFNEAAGINLAGTLTLPRGKGPFTAVVLVSGSGPQNRDEELMGHKPFLVLSDYLTRNGIAIIRYDDRGTAGSEGDFASATTLDLSTDAKAAFEFALKDSRINNVGILGHSEGGLIAPMLASEDERISFIILLAGPGLQGVDILKTQTQVISEKSGLTEKKIQQLMDINTEIFKIIMTESDNAKALTEVNQKFVSMMKASGEPEENIEIAKNDLNNKLNASSLNWLRFFLKSNPPEYLSKVTCPVLALNGDKDLQVIADENLGAIEETLKSAGNKNFEIVSFPGLNHLFQEANTGLPSEYSEIEETMSPHVLETIKEWIQKITK